MTQNNKVMGIIGAVVGTILGLVVWCLIGMAGYISWIGGLALAAGAIFGYKFLGKEEVKGVGAIVCAVLILVAVYIGSRMNYAIQIHQEFEETPSFALATEILGLDSDASTMEIFMDFNDYVEAYDDIMETYGTDGTTFSGEFKKDLIFGYVVTIIASVAIVVQLKKKS